MTLIIDFLVISGLILGIWLFSEPRKARFGNFAAAFSLFCAFVLILYRYQIINVNTVAISLMFGAIVGYVVARSVNMNQIPAMVAIQNGAGGAAAFLVSFVELTRADQSLNSVTAISGIIGLAVGAFTFSGSMVAGAKLANKMRQSPQTLSNHNFLVLVTIWGMFAACATSFHVSSESAFYLHLVQIVLSCLLGILFSIRIGGADMPVLISFLNSMTGMAAALCGMVLSNRLLIAFGAIVASSGYILTYMMCKAMNRNIIKVFIPDSQPSQPIAQSTTVISPEKIAKDSNLSEAISEPQTEVNNEADNVVGDDGQVEAVEPVGSVDPLADAAKALLTAKSVIVIPGYGMALAKAQFKVLELASILTKRGASVKYAIHPVAGRMPGHMNVILAEAEVDYDDLIEMEDVNSLFSDTDVAMVIGACDVVNSAAIEVEGTPISGMPILLAHEAKQIIVCNFDDKPGYSGVPNPLYKNSKTVMIQGDAKATVTDLIARLN
ncbi:MAG: NAD(P)(+) transhydrogenase (Re/Si-specific) subunit beta [Desulfamplus sp.]|nr:NAD(P)(+) transhydrogenase (Re/Si-specific) subunit beta [Desulfamplus sp.]